MGMRTAIDEIPKTLFLFLLIFVIVPLISCGGNNSMFKDGCYSAVASDYDSRGWKDYLTIIVSGGEIIHAEYNAFNMRGFVKTWDMDLKRDMYDLNRTYPSAYIRYYTRYLLQYQSTEGINVMSGASESYPLFIALGKAVLENAREGNNVTVEVHVDGENEESPDKVQP